MAGINSIVCALTTVPACVHANLHVSVHTLEENRLIRGAKTDIHDLTLVQLFQVDFSDVSILQFLSFGICKHSYYLMSFQHSQTTESQLTQCITINQSSVEKENLYIINVINKSITRVIKGCRINTNTLNV